MIASSSQVKIKLAVPTATTIADQWTLDASDNSPLTKATYESSDYTQDKTVNLNSPAEYIQVSVFDQFGNDFTIDGNYFFKYESLDNDIAVVDATSGKVTPRKAGDVPVPFKI